MLYADAQLARRLEVTDAESQLDWIAACHRLYPNAGSCVEPVAGGYTYFAGAGSPISRAIGLGFAGPVTAADLDRLEAFYTSRGATPQLDLCPLADPSLMNLLGERGYRIQWFLNVLVRPVLPGEMFESPAQGVTVELAGPEDPAEWVEAVAAGFGDNSTGSPDEVRIELVNIHKADNACYLARVDGQAAGGGCMTIRDGLAGLFGASTRPEFRRRGAQSALLNARLADAASAGCDLVRVITSPGSQSQRNAERAGFRMAYTKLRMGK